MTRDDEKMQQKGNVLIVGIKLDSSGRELLTWTLAKFTNAGDHVIALHIASSSSQADALRSSLNTSKHQTEAVFDSIIGVYESFCSIKKVDLQVKVANGPSLKRALVEEAKKFNAVRLILGHALSKPHIGPSFSLAKYCSRRLPMTCTITVIQHGQVSFEKEGALRNPGDSSGVLSTIQKTMRSHSWKSPGQHHIDRRRVGVSSQPSAAEMMQDENGNVACLWPLPTRFLDSPISVLHANYKFAALRTQSMKITWGDLGSPSSVLSSPSDLLMPALNTGGTEKLPARVPTLEPDDEAVCWGVAYCIKDKEAAKRAMAYLNVRESEYDIVKGLEFYTEDSPKKPVVSEVLVFMSTLDKQMNKYYLGAAPRDDIAMQIATATGPNGPNCDYLFRLVEALREIGHEDMEVTELASDVRRRLSEKNHWSQNASSKSLFTSPILVPKSPLLPPSPLQGVSLSHSPRLVKSEAR